MPDTEARDRAGAYGYRVLQNQIRSQQIYGLCDGIRPSIRPTFDELETLRASADERHALACQTVIAVLQQRVPVWDTWDPCKGAALDTYFVRALHHKFPAVFQRWQKTRQDQLKVRAAHAVVLTGKDAPADPVAGAIARDELERALRTVGPEVRSVLGLVAAGYEHSEIAERLRLSERAVEGRVYRFRRNTRNP